MVFAVVEVVAVDEVVDVVVVVVVFVDNDSMAPCFLRFGPMSRREKEAT